MHEIEMQLLICECTSKTSSECLTQRSVLQIWPSPRRNDDFSVPMLEIFDALQLLQLFTEKRRNYFHCAGQPCKQTEQTSCLLSADSDAFHCFCYV
jgi:hypothetical protein